MADRTCAVEGCEKPRHARGWCPQHYWRWRNHGGTALPEQAPHLCDVEGCEESHHGRGKCKLHHRRDYYLRNGERERAAFVKWRTANLDHERARWDAWYAEHGSGIRERRRERYAANPEKFREEARKYRRSNPGAHNRWREANPESWALRNRENQRRRRAKGDPVDYNAILARDGMVCHICAGAIESLADLHFDHVIPLSKGGPHHADNVRPAHAACNLRKGARLA